MDAKGTIEKALKDALGKLGYAAEAVLDHPADLSHGDYSSNAALVLAKAAKKNPNALAVEIVSALGEIEGVSKIEVAGAGFINFHLARGFFPQSVASVLENESEWGKGDILAGQRVMFEYTDPNPFKVFHIGHLMSNAIGESLARLSEFQGGVVVRANYQGDIGPHVAKCLWGIKKEDLNPNDVDDLGKAYVIGSTAYEDDAEAKAEIDAINKKLYAGDAEWKPLYDAGRKTSLDHFEELYALLGTKFDHYFFESVMGPIGVEVVKEGMKNGVFEESDGAVVYKGEKVGLHTRVFLTSQGTPTYEAKELGLDKTKFEKEKLNHSIIVTAVEQAGFFKVVLAAMAEVLPEVAAHTEHVWHGMMQLTGGKMSSRKGNVVTGESLIEDMREKAFEKMAERELGDAKKEIADSVAVAAIKYGVLKQAIGKNIIFDPEASLSFEGDSGPYLQYSHARALSVLRKAAEEQIKTDTIYSIGSVPEGTSVLEKLLYRFPEVAARAYETREPHHVTTFLTELAGAFNSWYAGEKIVDKTDPHSPYKVALTKAFAATMKNGLWLLGIRAPERM